MRRGAATAIVASGVLVVASAAVVAWVALGRGPSADDAAARYVAALGAGDLDALRDLEAVDAGTAALAFEAATARVEDAEITGIRTEGDHAVVEATGRIADTERPLDFSLRREEGAWVVEDNLGRLELTTTLGDTLRVGDADVPAGSVGLLPAGYTVSPAPGEVLEGSQDVSIGSGQTVAVAIAARLRDDAAARAQPLLDAYTASCTTTAVAVPAACGLRIPWAADLATADRFAYRVERMPQLTFEGAWLFAAVGGDYVVTVSGTTREGAAATVTFRDDDWTLRGSYDLDGGELALRPF